MKIYNPKSIWFTADTHFDHKNIIKYCNRPFNSIGEMNSALIDNWNSVVKKDDLVIHNGDFCFGGFEAYQQYRDELNGKIILIRGNHDKIQTSQLCKIFGDVCDYLKISVADNDLEEGWQKIIICHYAFRVWENCHHGSWNLYGHSHGTLDDDPNLLSIDIGVDCHKYTPISYNQIKDIMSRKIFKPVDHHTRNKI